jgi:hypothetical protein
MRRGSCANNNRGSIIIYVMIMLPIFLTIIFYAGNKRLNNQKEQIRIRVITTSQILRSNLMAYLQDNTAWQKTVADASANYNMDCLRSHSTCSIGSGGQIVVKDSEGNLVYDPTLGNSGITKSGVNCNAPFSSSCPIQLSLNWAPDCTLPCAPTKVIINGQFFVDSQLIVNTQVYDFQFSQNVP